MFCNIDHLLLFSCVPGRTFPTHPYFQAQLGAGQLSLYNLLKAYSLLDPEVSFNSCFCIISGFLPLSLSFWDVSLLLTQWINGLVNCLVGLSPPPPFLFCAGIKFVIVVIVGGLLSGPVLHCWSAAVTHGGRGRLQHAQISNVWRGAPQTVQAWHDYPAGKTHTSLIVPHLCHTHLQNLALPPTHLNLDFSPLLTHLLWLRRRQDRSLYFIIYLYVHSSISPFSLHYMMKFDAFQITPVCCQNYRLTKWHHWSGWDMVTDEGNLAGFVLNASG